MLSIELWYPGQDLRDLCALGDELLPALGMELLASPKDRIEMGMVADWELATLAGSRVYVGLTEGDYAYGVVCLFVDDEDEALTAAMERCFAQSWDPAAPARPAEGFLLRGLDDASGPMFCITPDTARAVREIGAQVGRPGDSHFRPQLRALGPKLRGAIGPGNLDAICRKRASATHDRGTTLWIDFSWTHFRPGWAPP